MSGTKAPLKNGDVLDIFSIPDLAKGRISDASSASDLNEFILLWHRSTPRTAATWFGDRIVAFKHIVQRVNEARIFPGKTSLRDGTRMDTGMTPNFKLVASIPQHGPVCIVCLLNLIQYQLDECLDHSMTNPSDRIDARIGTYASCHDHCREDMLAQAPQVWIAAVNRHMACLREDDEEVAQVSSNVEDDEMCSSICERAKTARLQRVLRILPENVLACCVEEEPGLPIHVAIPRSEHNLVHCELEVTAR